MRTKLTLSLVSKTGAEPGSEVIFWMRRCRGLLWWSPNPATARSALSIAPLADRVARCEQLANIFHGFSTGLCAVFRLRSADNC
jgi:hypothetical protein